MAITIDEYEQIYKRCFNRAMGLAVSLLHDEDDARDAVQDVFLHLWETRKEISTPDAYI
ncbi:MAG: hypothetical protein HUJ99_04445, partial [Bacteroidaceae bacterium]|nr:hypothetical protein [Bacteroidaceae bacterium]